MMQERDESLRSEGKESKAKAEESTYKGSTWVKQSLKLEQPVGTD